MSDKPIAEWELDLLCPSNGRDCDHANGVCKDYRPATAAPIFVPSEAFVVPLEDPTDLRQARTALAEKIAGIAEEAADELDLPVMAEWLDQRDWFKGQLHALAARAREEGGIS